MRADPDLERELTERLARQTPVRAVGVTDLLSLRRAFYRAVGPPVPVPPARQARLDEGRTLHRWLGSRLAREGTLEARVRRDGLVGRIDILADVPIEVKTSSSLVDPSDLPALRPEHVEQLGMYCALVGQKSGRLVTLLSGTPTPAHVQAIDFSYRSVERILVEMRRRADLLQDAWAEGRPDELPRCPWLDRGCEYRDAGVCSCTGEEEETPPWVREEVDAATPRADVEERVRTELSEPFPDEGAGVIERFREVLYPRRAFFERTSPVAAPPPSAAPPRPAIPEKDLFARLQEALESGPPGEVARVPSRSLEPEEEVVGFRGRPLLLRTSWAWSRYREEELLPRAPQYVLELGLRCAVTGTDGGLVAVGFERAEVDRDRLQVLEVRFDSVTPFSRLFRERSRELAAALRDNAPGRLAACPEWMTTDCPYRAECGCASSEGRVTR